MDSNNESQNDFGIRGYTPSWFEYETLPDRVREIVASALGTRLEAIYGVFSSEGWEPDWPLFLQFESSTCSIHTKSSYLWSIEPWDTLAKQLEISYPDFWVADVCADSIPGSKSMAELRNQKLNSIHWPANRDYGETQGLVLSFNDQHLHVYDAGDSLGFELLAPNAKVMGSLGYELICAV